MLEVIIIKSYIAIFEKNTSYHRHFFQIDYNGICDWEILITNNAEMEKFLRQKELYWYHKLKTLAGFGPNEHHVYMMLHIRQGGLSKVWI